MKDAEMTLMSEIIRNPKFYYQNHDLISEDLFEDPSIRSIFAIYKSVSASKTKVEFIDIWREVQDRQMLNDIYAHEGRTIFDATNALSYLYEGLLVKKVRQSLLDGNDLINRGEDIFHVINAIEESLLNVKDIRNTKFEPLTSQIDQFFERRSRDNSDITGLRTGFSKYDNFTGGLQRGDLIIIAGETSQGKTSFALDVLLNSSANGAAVLMMSLEMSTDQLISRLLSKGTNITVKDILRNISDEETGVYVRQYAKELSAYKLHIHECHATSIDYIADNIKAYKIIYGIDCVVIDYLQLISHTDRKMNREQAVGHVVRRLKNLAVELNINIIALSQLSRDRQNPAPRMSRLRDSGQIEEAADQVIFVYRPEEYGFKEFDDGTPCEGMADIILAKGRNTGTMSMYLKFIKPLTKFVETKALVDTNNLGNNDKPF